MGADVIKRTGIEASEIDRGHIGPFAGFQAAGFAIDSQRPRAVDRRHLQHRRRRQGRGVFRHEFAEQRRRAHFAEHVEVVVAGSAVGAQRNIHACLEQVGDPAGAARELQIGFGTMYDRGASCGEHRNFLIEQLRGVHALETRTDQAEFLKPGKGAPSVRANRLVDFGRSLVNMDVDRRAEILRVPGRRAQLIVRYRIWSMGTERDVQPRMFAEALAQLPRLVQVFFRAGCPDRGEIQNRPA